MTEDNEPFLPDTPTTTLRPSPYDSLVNIIAKALRSEGGVRRQQSAKKSTEYYAGRRAGLIMAAAVILEQMYSVSYDQGKAVVAASVKKAGEDRSHTFLYDAARCGQLASEVATAAIEYR